MIEEFIAHWSKVRKIYSRFVSFHLPIGCIDAVSTMLMKIKKERKVNEQWLKLDYHH
jgi:hypothetical protein